MPSKQHFSNIVYHAEVTFCCDDDNDVHFVLDQHA
jgi:hypothetical protein